jgi:hypothetical protein
MTFTVFVLIPLMTLVITTAVPFLKKKALGGREPLTVEDFLVGFDLLASAFRVVADRIGL